MPAKQSGDKAATGRAAELAAKTYLIAQGLSYIESNYRCRSGEIDLIMRDKNTLVFVEVKFRRSSRFGSALETVTIAKQQKIVKAAQHYLLTNKLGENQALRFDVLGIENSLSSQATDATAPSNVQWIKAAF